MNMIEQLEAEEFSRVVGEKNIPEFSPGDTLSVNVRIKEGDRERFRFHAETTDKLVLFATNGRFYTLSCGKLPGGRGLGEPVRLMIDLPNDDEMVALFAHKPGAKRLLASSTGDGFVLNEAEAIAQTRSGKQALNVKAGGRATPVNAPGMGAFGRPFRRRRFVRPEARYASASIPNR